MLASKNRFHGHGSLNYLFRHGQTTRGHYLLLRSIGNSHRSQSRVAVIASKKISKSAVVRNRVRRRVFEAVRLCQPAFKGVHDLAFIALKPELAVIPADELKKDVEFLLKRAKILPK